MSENNIPNQDEKSKNEESNKNNKELNENYNNQNNDIEDNKNGNKNINDDNNFKKGFFKKVWYSIVKIERYAEMATEGVGRALSYLSKLVIILAIIISVWITIETNNNIQKAIDYLENNFPEISYKEGTLQVESNEPIVIDNEVINGKIIVDTNTDSEETINQYINTVNEYGSGIIVLKNRVILSNMTMAGTISYNYKEAFDNINISEFNKKDIVEYSSSNNMITLYISIFATLFIYSYVWYLIKALWYVATISIFGYLVAWLLKIKMRYAPIFNMSIYAITLSIILNMIYIIINMFTNFTIEYFEVMYISVASIYLISAIFIIKSEFIKKQAELLKIAKAQEVIRKQMEQEKEEEKNKKEEKEQNKDTGKEEKKEDKENKDKKGDELGEQPEGSNA